MGLWEKLFTNRNIHILKFYIKQGILKINYVLLYLRDLLNEQTLWVIKLKSLKTLTVYIFSDLVTPVKSIAEVC